MTKKCLKLMKSKSISSTSFLVLTVYRKAVHNFMSPKIIMKGLDVKHIKIAVNLRSTGLDVKPIKINEHCKGQRSNTYKLKECLTFL